MKLKNIELNVPKKVLGIFTLFTALLLSVSCVNLDQDPEEFDPRLVGPQNLDDIENTVFGIYNKLNSAAHWSEFYITDWASDGVTTWSGGNKADFRQFDQRNVLSTNNRLLTLWDFLYEVIIAANQTLDQIDNAGESITSVPENVVKLAELKAESRFLRGIAYHHLVRIYGYIPIQEETLPRTDLYLSSFEDTYAFIEADFLDAAANLPEVALERGHGRPTKMSASAFLSRLYLDWAGYPVKDASKYTLAAQEANKVISSGEFMLSADFNDLWQVYSDDGQFTILEAHRFNPESIFTVFYCNDCSRDLFGQTDANFKYGLLGMPELKGTSISGWSEAFSEIRFFEEMPTGTRKEITYGSTFYDYKFWSPGNWNQRSPSFTKISGRFAEKAFENLNGWTDGAFRSDKSDYLMRYAEVLLIYAEASDQSGFVGSMSAQAALSEVQTRAGYDDLAQIPTGSFVEQVIEEKKWEFPYEGVRWNDLVRTETVAAALSNRDVPLSTVTDVDGVAQVNPDGGNWVEFNPVVGATSASIENYFHPIPASVSAQNPNFAAGPQ